jgi:hypothetical protein
VYTAVMFTSVVYNAATFTNYVYLAVMFISNVYNVKLTSVIVISDVFTVVVFVVPYTEALL